MNEGWICPRCKKVNAPNVKSCDCVEEKDKDEGRVHISFPKEPFEVKSPDVKQCDCKHENGTKDFLEEFKKLMDETKGKDIEYIPYYPYPYYPWHRDWTNPYWPYTSPYIVTFTSDSASNK